MRVTKILRTVGNALIVLFLFGLAILVVSAGTTGFL